MKYEIYYNGERVSMKWLVENFGSCYANEIKSEIKNSKPFDSIHNNNGTIDIYIW